MRVQPISINNFNTNKVKKTYSTGQIKNSSTSFKSEYENVMKDVLKRSLKSRCDVSNAMSDLYHAASNEKNATRSPMGLSIGCWIYDRGATLIEELCKPIAELRSEFRDLVIKAKKEYSIPILEKDKKSLFDVVHCGKHGFFDSIFENESAPNDIRLKFHAENGTFEVGTNKKGNVVTTQYWDYGPWTENTYAWGAGLIKQKTGNLNDTITWPTV